MQAEVILDELLERGLNPELARIKGGSIVLRWELTRYGGDAGGRVVAKAPDPPMYYFSTPVTADIPRSNFRVSGLPRPAEPHSRLYRLKGGREGGTAWRDASNCPCDRVVLVQWDAWYVADFKRYGAELRLPGIWPASRTSYIHADVPIGWPDGPESLGYLLRTGQRARFTRLACPNCLFTIGWDKAEEW